jgi:hypothetical protein
MWWFVSNWTTTSLPNRQKTDTKIRQMLQLQGLATVASVLASVAALSYSTAEEVA